MSDRSVTGQIRTGWSGRKCGNGRSLRVPCAVPGGILRTFQSQRDAARYDHPSHVTRMESAVARHALPLFPVVVVSGRPTLGSREEPLQSRLGRMPRSGAIVYEATSPSQYFLDAIVYFGFTWFPCAACRPVAADRQADRWNCGRESNDR